jgi:DNA-binding NtrC family response regulator
MDASIIVVDDDFDFLELMKARLIGAGFRQVRIEDNPLKAAARFEAEETYDIALVDMTMPELDGLALIDEIKNYSPQTECIMVTAVNDARIAVKCLRKGAYDYLVKPVREEDLVFSLKRALEKKRLQDILEIEKSRNLPTLSNPAAFKTIVTRSPKMQRLLKEAELHAGSDVPILITGESGTGKELLALAIHAASSRARYPFMPVNMAAITAGLFEAEFFGHTRGAFTGAENERNGILRHAHHGSLFLDEIGNIPAEMQGKLLRVLQDGAYSKLGTSEQQKVDVRVIAATNEDLESLISRKMFRKDLYYRIRGGWLDLPPLRERTEDIALLVNYFLRQYCAPASPCGVKEDALCLLMEYEFPGNVRELQAVIQSAVNLSQGSDLTVDSLPSVFKKPTAVTRCHKQTDEIENLLSLDQVEKKHIIGVYHLLGKNKSKTARQLGIGLNTLRRRLQYYGEN